MSTVSGQPRVSTAIARLLASVLALLVMVVGLVAGIPAPALASPGLCIGPGCADQINRSAKYHWQLNLRVADQRGHRERLIVDCRDGVLSPLTGSVERGYAAAVARRACRLAGEA